MESESNDHLLCCQGLMLTKSRDYKQTCELIYSIFCPFFLPHLAIQEDRLRIIIALKIFFSYLKKLSCLKNELC